MVIDNVFGIDVGRQFHEWFNGEFAERFAQRHPGEGITLVILDPDKVLASMLAWRDPLVNMMIVAHIGDDEAAFGSGGTQQNVAGKLQFVLRNQLDSSEARKQPELVRPGDFPYQGAGFWGSVIGGVSGLSQEDDWATFQICAEKLTELLRAANTAAMDQAEKLGAQDDCPIDTKYLRGIVLADIVPDPAPSA